MEIGKLDTLIRVYFYTLLQQANGEQVVDFTDEIDLWAKISYQAVVETQQAGGRTATSELIFTVRYHSGITERCKILYLAELYEITGLKHYERNSYTEITAKKFD